MEGRRLAGCGMYDELGPTLRGYVDRLLEHASTALWPERRMALEGVWRGITKSAPEDRDAAAQAIGLQCAEGVDPGDVVFRMVLTAYLERLDEREVTNPDQALIYSLSLFEDHADLAEAWFATHPDQRPAGL